MDNTVTAWYNTSPGGGFHLSSQNISVTMRLTSLNFFPLIVKLLSVSILVNGKIISKNIPHLRDITERN